MARCPLCGTELVIDTCPRCLPQAAVPDAAAALPEGGPDPLPVETREKDDHGYLPAAAIFAAQGLASLLAFGAGAPPEIISAVLNLMTAAFLLRQAGWAKWLVLVGALLGAGQGLFAFVLTGHWLAVVATLPSVCVLGAFWLETPRLRLAAAGVGIVLAFSWFGLAASVTGEDGSDPLADYLVAQRTFSDPVAGLGVSAPPELELYDLQKLRADTKGRRGGVLGLLAKDGLALEGAGDRVLARSAKDDVVAVVSVGSLPPQMPSESLLPTLLGGAGRVERVDELVPRPLRTSGLATQAWRDPTRQVLILRAPDGRMATVVCTIHQRAAERLCGALFSGVALTLGKRPGWEQQAPGPPPQ